MTKKTRFGTKHDAQHEMFNNRHNKTWNMTRHVICKDYSAPLKRENTGKSKEVRLEQPKRG